MSRYANCIIAAPVLMFTLQGCSGLENSPSELGYNPETKPVEQVRSDMRRTSSNILDVTGLAGQVTEPGPGVSLCEGLDSDRFYKIRHPWSIYGIPVDEMKQAMTRLKEELPKHGWNVTSFGPNSSPAESLELMADSKESRFSVRITLQDRRARSDNPSMIEVTVVSACFEVPEGETVDEY